MQHEPTLVFCKGLLLSLREPNYIHSLSTDFGRYVNFHFELLELIQWGGKGKKKIRSISPQFQISFFFCTSCFNGIASKKIKTLSKREWLFFSYAFKYLHIILKFSTSFFQKITIGSIMEKENWENNVQYGKCLAMREWNSVHFII